MNQQEFERQQRVCQEQSKKAIGVAVGGKTLGYMSPFEGIGKPYHWKYCGDEEQEKFRVGCCHDNAFHLNNKIKGQVWNGYRTLPNGKKDKAPHYWVVKNNSIWDINTFMVPSKKDSQYEGAIVRVWGYCLYKPQDYFDRYKVSSTKRIR